MKPLQVPLPLNTGELLNVEEAAERMGMSVRYVRRLIAERRIAFYRIGRSIRIDSADLTALVESSRVEPITSASVWNDVRTVAL